MKDQPKTSNGGKILIAYASQFGTTGEVAEAIAEALRDDGYITEVRRANSIENLNGYDGVIIGGAIQYDKWMPEATSFISDNQDALGTMPVAFFFTCLTLSRHTEKARRQAQTYSDRLFATFSHLEPTNIGRFAGVLDYSKIPIIPRMVVRIVFAFLGVKEGDHRDWPAIKSWAKNTSTKFST